MTGLPKERLLLAQVGLSHLFVLGELRGLCMKADLTSFHDVSVVSDAERHPGVLFDEEDRRLKLSVDLNYAIADGIYALLFPDKTGLNLRRREDDFQLCLDFG